MNKSKRMPKSVCHDCGVEEGELHQLGCDMECCPFCGAQLISCDCCYEKLGLRDPNQYDSTTAFLPPEIYKRGLPAEQSARWEALLNAKERIPFILYPILCARCGTLWPDLFKVPDEEWKRYIQPDMRDKVICRSCYGYIKHVIDTAARRRKWRVLRPKR